MLLPSEIEAKAIIPALRAIIAKKLVRNHGMSQQKVADLLGLTQAAVSNYLRETRGRGFNLEGMEDVQTITDRIVSLLIQGAKPVTILSGFHEAANLIKDRRILCGAHQKLEPTFDVEECNICNSGVTLKP